MEQIKQNNIYVLLATIGQKTNLYIDGKQEKLPETYIPNPPIVKNVWEQLGNKLSINEKIMQNICGSKYYSVRLDGKNFSNIIPSLRRLGIFSDKYSFEFEKIMIATMKNLCDIFSGWIYAFTQSDEITIIFKPANICNDIQQEHIFSGRHDKIATLMASTATSTFIKHVMILAITKNLPIELLERIPNVCFDGRIGIYNTCKDAFELILWRAYDCGVNGLSSGVLTSNIIGATKMNGACCDKKIAWLSDNGLLPLPPHQTYGTFLFQTKEPKECENIKTKEKHIKLVWTLHHLNGPVIVNFQKGFIPFWHDQKE